MNPTLADIAEKWARETGRTIPARDSRAWLALYFRWHRFAFKKTRA
jgi:hypothetical protein